MSTKENPQQIREYSIYIPSTKQRVPVTKEVYQAYYQPIWNIFRKTHRHQRCSCPGNRWWLCEGDCAVCKYCTAGDNLSLDYELEVVGDIHPDDAAPIDELVTDSIAFGQLLKRLDELMPDARRIGKLRLAGYSDSAIADIIGVPRTTFLSRIKKAEALLHDEYHDIF